MTLPATIWNELELEPTRDVRSIKRAYARKLKLARPQEDPQGFQRLRAAYEAALALANQPASVDGEAQSASPQAATRGEAVAPQPDPERIALQQALADAQAAFRKVQMALNGRERSDEQTLVNSLQQLLAAPAFANVSLLHEVEDALGRLLADSIPRSDPLLQICIKHFDWYKHEKALSPSAAVLAVLARQRDLELLHELQSGRTPRSRTFLRLTGKQNALLRWWRAHSVPHAQSPELRLLTFLGDQHPRVLTMIDAKVIAWWQRFQSRPQLSHGLSRLGAVLTGLAALFGVIAGAEKGSALTSGLIGALSSASVFAVLLAAKLYVIDWPVLLIARRWQGRLPIRWQLNWLPAVLAMMLIMAALPESSPLATPTLIVGVVCCLWAVYVSGPLASVVQNGSILIGNSHLANAVLTNLPLASWWFLFRPLSGSLLGDAKTIAALTAMCGVSFGMRPLAQAWHARLQCAQRQVYIAALGLLAACAAALAWRWSASAILAPIAVTFVIAIVLLHRVPALSFSGKQIKARVWILGVGSVLASAAAGLDSDSSNAQQIIKWGAVLFMVTTTIDLAMALYNERKLDA